VEGANISAYVLYSLCLKSADGCVFRVALGGRYERNRANFSRTASFRRSSSRVVSNIEETPRRGPRNLPSPNALTVPVISNPGTYGNVQGATPCSPPEKSFQSIGFTAARSTFTKSWPGPRGGISTSFSSRDAMVSPGLPSAPYADACQAFMVGIAVLLLA